jgi:HSP20 family molecular chaperone IbpA
MRAELPGVEKDNIDIRCLRITVSIAVEKKSDTVVEEDRWIKRESTFGRQCVWSSWIHL